MDYHFGNRDSMSSLSLTNIELEQCLPISSLLLQRKNPMAWGTTTGRVTTEINPFPYARETKYLTLKELETYLISDG